MREDAIKPRGQKKKKRGENKYLRFGGRKEDLSHNPRVLDQLGKT